jgi:branched-chain amino acid transport system permease protein
VSLTPKPVTAGARSDERAPRASRRLAGASKSIGVVVAIVAVLIWRHDELADGSVVTQALVSGVLLGGVYGLVAMGLTLIFGVLEIVNFAHGALMTVGMYCAFVLAADVGIPFYATLPITVLALFVLGVIIHRVLIARAMGQPLENQLLLTLGLAIFIENALLLGFSGTPKSVDLAISDDSLSIFGASADVTRVVAFGGALALAAVLYGLLQRTKLGTSIRAVASNPGGASLVGIDTARVYMLTFAIGTACVGAAAALVVPFLSLQPTTGGAFTILAFVVVVLGGLGNVVGAVLGGLVIGLTQQVGGILFPEQSDLLAVFVVFVLVLFLRPQGLLGKAPA